MTDVACCGESGRTRGLESQVEAYFQTVPNVFLTTSMVGIEPPILSVGVWILVPQATSPTGHPLDEANIPGIDPTPTGPPQEVTTWMDDDHEDNNSSTESTNEIVELEEEEAESEHDHSDDDNYSLHNSDNEVV